MTLLPDEIWTSILDYLDPVSIVASQRVSHRLLKLARDSSLWRNKVFEKAPSAAHSHATSPNALSALAGALGGLSLGEPSPAASAQTGGSSGFPQRSRTSQRAKAVLEWDKSHPSEKTDWYSEYIARNAPLSTIWADSNSSLPEIRGISLFGKEEKVICPLEDGSLSIWDIRQSDNDRRSITQLGRSRSNLLFQDMYSLGESSYSKRAKPLGASVENISVDSRNMRAFVAVEHMLNEVDLEKMEVVSQSKFAWPITALSQENNVSCNLTVGTSFSLHIYDPRLPITNFADTSDRLDVNEDSKIAFLQNYSKALDMRLPVDSSPEVVNDYRSFSNQIGSYAVVEPGPQSIIHHGESEIIIAGRMPSILFYDRRYFPQPQTAIHSGARLSAMTLLPVPPTESGTESGADSTLIACGEYGGRGSLEIYELPWNHGTSISSTRRSTDHTTHPTSPTILSQRSYRPFSSRNRQEASSSKLLSVATQGTRIVFSDSEGTLKWVERDGRGLARRWNINAFQLNERGTSASVTGDKVVRKMLAIPEAPTEYGTRGDTDLLIWTGEKIGIVTTKPKPWGDHEDLVQAFERSMDLRDRDERSERDREAEYHMMMRRALERQADERRWMSRFGGRSGR